MCRQSSLIFYWMASIDSFSCYLIGLNSWLLWKWASKMCSHFYLSSPHLELLWISFKNNNVIRYITKHGSNSLFLHFLQQGVDSTSTLSSSMLISPACLTQMQNSVSCSLSGYKRKLWIFFHTIRYQGDVCFCMCCGVTSDTMHRVPSWY